MTEMITKNTIVSEIIILFFRKKYNKSYLLFQIQANPKSHGDPFETNPVDEKNENKKLINYFNTDKFFSKNDKKKLEKILRTELSAGKNSGKFQLLYVEFMVYLCVSDNK